MNKAILLLISSITFAACTGNTSDRSAAVVRDSAGIRIVENEAPSWSPSREWRLGDAPALDIGATAGDPNYELFRALSAERLSSGRIAVTNAYHEIRYYDGEGRYLQTVGGQGSGPGEFQRLERIYGLPGDSLLAYDQRLARYSLFAPDGHHVRTVNLRMDPQLGGPMLSGVFGDGSLLVSARQRANPSELEIGLHRDPVPLYHFNAAGEQAAHLGVVPGDEVYVHESERGISFDAPLLGRKSSVVASGDHWYAADSDVFEIRVFAMDGHLSGIIRSDVTPTAVAPNHVDAVLEALLSQIPDGETRQRAEEQYRSLPVAETLPLIGLPAFGPPRGTPYPALRVDDDGNVWVLTYNVHGVNEPSRWSVFDAEGTLLGDVVMPAGFWPTDIGDEFVLGVWQDELDVEHVRLYQLLKP